MAARPERIGFITGTRADYGLLAPIMSEARGAGLDVSVLACGMHLSPVYGETIREIEADGNRIDARVPLLAEDDTPAATARALGNGIVGLTDALEETDPDVVVLLGDRHEAMAGAVATVTGGRLLAHVHGGDRSRGGLDESFRHAITKLAHLHFTATEQSRERVLRLGEPPELVFNVGAPGLDSIRTMTRLSRGELSAAVGVDLPNRYLVLIQHPVSTDSDAAENQMEMTLRAIRACGVHTVAILPNSDAGGRRATALIEGARNDGTFHVFRNLAHSNFLNLLSHATALVGNSSCGIIEAASFGLPVVDIGSRQDGRQRSSNVLSCDHSTESITAALNVAVGDDRFREQARQVINPYGDGTAAKRVVEVLAGTTLSGALLQKQIAY